MGIKDSSRLENSGRISGQSQSLTVSQTRLNLFQSFKG
jgi:hypothetical protein